MCGITGKINFNNNKVSHEEIATMNAAISHRGPNDSGIFTDGSIGLGHQRLSIIDLSPLGHQPMSDSEGNIWLVFNGEIYNFQQLRKELEKDGVKFKSKSDTETIIYLYKKYGTNCLKYLRGMFSFAIWDKEKKVLFIARDRVGKKPLKYYVDDKCFIFSSELKAILKNSEVRKEIDFTAIDEYLTYQYIPHPKTGFKNIFKLPAAHFLLIKLHDSRPPEVIGPQRYWELDYTQKLDLSKKEWEERVEDKLQEAVDLRLISDVPFGAHLSGGIDSSLIVALMAKTHNEPIKTFSIGFEEEAYNELPFARLVAEKYKTEHQEFIIKPNAIEILPQLAYHYEEPFADSSALPTWYLSELTKKHVTVALNGDGGDENFAGYSRYSAAKIFDQLKVIPFKKPLSLVNKAAYEMSGVSAFRKAHRLLSSYESDLPNFYLRLIDYFDQTEKGLLYSTDFQKKIVDSRWQSFLKEKFESAKANNWLDTVLSADINSYLQDDLLVKVDIASMAHALEIRSPFLDQELLELTAQMPPHLKLKGHNKKYLLKQIAYKYLPKECIDRPKQGFGVPLEFWFRGQLENHIRTKLLGKKFLDYGFNKDEVERLINDHLGKKQNYAYHLWALVMLEQWLSTYFD